MKQGTKLVRKTTGEKVHIGGVFGELFGVVAKTGSVFIGIYTEKELLEYFTIVEEKWEPNEGGSYYYIGDRSWVSKSTWTGDDADLFRRDYLGIYQTKEEAQTARENMKKIR